MNKASLLDLLKTNCLEIIHEKGFKEKLAKGKRLIIKAGFDPTAPDIHLGHSILIRKLKQFQDLGHQVIVVIGDYTASIGDPTGKSMTRQPLSQTEIFNNSKTYQSQLFKILDPSKTHCVFNSNWLNPLSAKDLIQLASRYTLAQMIERDDFQNRYNNHQPIALHEFIYPLLTGYDSVHLKADVELGGSDQKFNLLVARELQKQYGQEPQTIITLPILEGLDGVKKMSKSLNNYIGILDKPELMFGKIMSINDDLMFVYYERLCSFDKLKINKLKKDIAGGLNPMELKINLAMNIIEQFHDKASAQEARAIFYERYKEKILPKNMPTLRLDIPVNGVTLSFLLKQLKLVKSSSEAHRLIAQNGIKINGEKIQDATRFYYPLDIFQCSIGKHKHVIIELKLSMN